MLRTGICGHQPSRSQEKISDNGAQKNRQINEGNPRLIVDIEFLPGQAPRMFDDHPAESIKHKADDGSDQACQQCLAHRRICQTMDIQISEQGKNDNIIYRMPRLCLFVSLARARAVLHGFHMEYDNIKKSMPDRDEGNNEIGNPKPSIDMPKFCMIYSFSPYSDPFVLPCSSCFVSLFIQSLKRNGGLCFFRFHGHCIFHV